MSNNVRRTGGPGGPKHAARTQAKGMKGRQVAVAEKQATEPRAKAKDTQKQASTQEKPKKLVEGSVTVAAKPATTASDPKQLEVALKLAILDMQRYDPSFTVSPEQFEERLAALVASTPKAQEDFIDKFLKPALEDYNYYNDPTGWGPWLKTGMDLVNVVTGRSLMDRAATFYKEGSETIAMMGALSGWVAEVATYQAKEHAYDIGANILGVTQEIAAVGSEMVNAIDSAVETIYDLAETAHPELTAEKPSPGLFSKESLGSFVETAIEFAHPDRLNKPEAVAEEAKQAAEAIVGLSPKEIVKNGAEAVLTTYLDYTTKHATTVATDSYTPVAMVANLLKKHSGNVGNAISELIKKGSWAALEALLTVVLMEEFGVKAAIPQSGALQPLATAPAVSKVAQPYFSQAAAICVLVNIAVSTIMKIIQNGKNPSAQQNVIAFLTKGPLSAKTMGIKGSIDSLLKSFFASVNPYISFALSGFLTIAADNVLGGVKGTVKKVAKGTLETTEKALTQTADLMDTLGGLGEEQAVQKTPPTKPRSVGRKGANKPRKSRSSRK